MLKRWENLEQGLNRIAWVNIDRKRLRNYCFSCCGFVEAANYQSDFG
jgi:hypothetical protein